MKRGVIFSLIFGVLLLSFVSAQFGYGYNFSVSGLIDSFLNSSSSSYILMFFALFTLIMIILSRIKLFKDAYGNVNALSAGVISFCISAATIYYLYQNGFRGEGLFSWLGLSGASLSIIILILCILVAILIIWKLGFKGLFFFGGLALILTGLFTELLYERGLAVIIGFLFLIIGFYLWQHTRGHLIRAGKWIGKGIRTGTKRKPMWAIAIIGLIIAGVGFSLGSIIITIIGLLVMLIGMGGKKAYSETVASGRGMSKRRAEAAAYEENEERERHSQQVRDHRQGQLQQAYDHYKGIAGNRNAPGGVRNMAEQEMRRIASEAAREGIQINY